MRIEFASEQLQRLINTPFFPRDPKEQRELLKACLSASTEKILACAIDDISKTAESQVTAATIYRAIDSNKKQDYWRPEFPLSRPKVDVPDMSAEQLDELPNYVSGLPTNPSRRAEALAAWDLGGPKGLNQWRQESLRAKIKSKPAPVASIPADSYHGDF